jgi:hypothetical protein
MRVNQHCRISYRLPRAWLAAAGLVLAGAAPAAPAGNAAPTAHTLVVCSPGSPGTTEDAQPRMDAFAAAVSARAGAPFAAVYEPSEDRGAARLAATGLGLVSLPFFLQHERELGLRARLMVVSRGRPALDRWALAVPRGRIHGPDGLAGFTIVSPVGLPPAFIRGVVLGGFGAVPATAKLVSSAAVLSALRRAASGDPVAVVLDGGQQASLPGLPFAARLEIAARSPPVPAALVVTIDARLPASAWRGIERALLDASADPAAAAALDAIRVARFAPVDDDALGRARTAFAGAAR